MILTKSGRCACPGGLAPWKNEWMTRGPVRDNQKNRLNLWGEVLEVAWTARH